MGNINVSSSNVVSASPETRDAIAKAAKDVAGKHIKAVKEISGSETAKSMAAAGAAGAAIGLISPVPGGAILGGIAGAAGAAVAKAGEKTAEKIKSSEKEKSAIKTSLVVGLLLGPVPAIGTYLFCSGKAKEGAEKMKQFIKEHPEALAAKAAN